MPELPEVETVRRQLASEILNRKILGIDLRYEGTLKSSPSAFAELIEGRVFTKVSRKGKLLIFHLSETDQLLHAHLKMTGQFLFQEQGETKAGIFPLLYAAVPGGKKTAGQFREDQIQAEETFQKHIHVVIHFEDGSQLAFRDQRKFGYLKLVSKAEHEQIMQRYGIDPMEEDFSSDNLKAAFKGRKKSLKSVLMDQQVIAGVGNIYADEICHRAGIRPHRSVAKLSQRKLEEITVITGEIMRAAIAADGTTFKDFITTDGGKGNFSYQLKVYAREGLACETCNSGTIQKERYLGRGTHYCPQCQR